MAEITSNRGLYLPGGGSTGAVTPDEVADIDRLNQNFRILDAWSGQIDASSGDARVGIGTTAERNDKYPVPATDSQRVALANSKPVWFNTDQMWQESYYAVTGKSGLTVPGLRGGSSSGWYPTSDGPRAYFATTGSQVLPSSGSFTKWDYNFTNGDSYRYGGVENIFPQSGKPERIQLGMPGIYRVVMSVYITNGSGVIVHEMRAHNAAATITRQRQTPLQLLAAYGQVVTFDLGSVPIEKDGFFSYVATSTQSGISYGGGDTGIHIQYLGPLLVND